MYLVQIFRASPLLGSALCVCLATILWCIFLTRKQPNGLDKILTGLLGLISIYEALRILKDSGVVSFSGLQKLDGWVDLLIASMCMTAAMILKLSTTDRASTKVRLRLVEANEKPLEITKAGAAVSQETAQAVFDASPLATFAVDAHDTVIYWNAAAEDLLEWKRDEVLGQKLPFPSNGPVKNRRGREIEAAVWTAHINSSNGSARATLTIAADGASLRGAGLSLPKYPAGATLALNS